MAEHGMICLQEELIYEIESDNIEGVIKLLNDGVNINFEHEYPLACAISMGNYDIIKLLIAAGSNINVRNSIFGSNIYYVCKKGDSHILELLLQEGSAIHNLKPGNLIHACCKSDNLQCLQLLIQNGLKFNEHARYYFTKVLENKSKNILEYILNNCRDKIKNSIIKINDEDIEKYLFIEMLVNRNLLDISD
jgi:hypothetical protein